MAENLEMIAVEGLKVSLGGKKILKGINLNVRKGEVLGIVGGSGSGKTTFLRSLLGLIKPQAGRVKIFGHELSRASNQTLIQIQTRWGVLFQQNALFSSLNLLENVQFPLREHTQLSEEVIQELALLRILMAGLPEDAAVKLPAELSGGMQKRAGLARALVLDPELIFLDEPTSGLDPTTAAAFDDLILKLQKTMGLTIVMVTHDLDSLWKITNRVAFLGNGMVIDVAPIEKLIENPDPAINEFFNGPRGKAAAEYGAHIRNESC